jgi:hypothetical protein
LVTLSFLADGVVDVVVDVVVVDVAVVDVADESEVVVVVVVDWLAFDEQPAKATAPDTTSIANILFRSTRIPFVCRQRSVSGRGATAMAGVSVFQGDNRFP